MKTNMDKMRNMLPALLFLLSVGLPAMAQTSKNQVVTQIRKAYAEAKQKIADNGKKGRAPMDVSLTMNTGTQVDEDFIINDITEVTFYFDRGNAGASTGDAGEAQCYFIVENWTANGHLRNKEMLFDRKDGHLMFAFVHAETHAGYTTESRFYFDARGQVVEEKYKEGGVEVTDKDQTWGDVNASLILAAKYQELFEALMSAPRLGASPSVPSSQFSVGTSAIANIRKTYAEAKAKIEKDSKSELPRNMQVVIRDQTWGPPMTDELNYYFDEVADQVEPDAVSIEKRCYFISDHRHHNRMGPDLYYEYLFKPNTDSLIFSYTNAKEEGEQYEWRYYFDDNGKCIEAKTNAEEHDNGAEDKQTAQHYLRILKLADSLLQ